MCPAAQIHRCFTCTVLRHIRNIPTLLWNIPRVYLLLWTVISDHHHCYRSETYWLLNYVLPSVLYSLPACLPVHRRPALLHKFCYYPTHTNSFALITLADWCDYPSCILWCEWTWNIQTYPSVTGRSPESAMQVSTACACPHRRTLFIASFWCPDSSVSFLSCSISQFIFYSFVVDWRKLVVRLVLNQYFEKSHLVLLSFGAAVHAQ